MAIFEAIELQKIQVREKNINIERSIPEGPGSPNLFQHQDNSEQYL